MILAIFNSAKHISSNVSALKGAFFKEPTWLNIQAGFIIEPSEKNKMKIQTEKTQPSLMYTGNLNYYWEYNQITNTKMKELCKNDKRKLTISEQI